MLPRSQFRKYSPQEILSPVNTLPRKHSPHWHSRSTPSRSGAALRPNCERESFHMFPCETFERHKLHVSLWDMYLHASLWDIKETHVSLWDIKETHVSLRERCIHPCETLEKQMHPPCETCIYMHPCETLERQTDASILGRGCIQHQVLSAIPFNINMIQVCKKWRREKLKSEQSIHSSPMMNFNFESESEQALTMRKNVTIGVNWPFIRLLRIILPDWIELM